MKKNGVSSVKTLSKSMRDCIDVEAIVSLYVDNISSVIWNKDAFERLVLPPQTKELVKALVMVRTAGRKTRSMLKIGAMRQDIISGKGNGLIMLLHGSPGTGKTLTAGMGTRLSPPLNLLAYETQKGARYDMLDL